ncbi:hypothetical protein F2Q69_00009539 [Brassica cretica]|uniref:Uncharacterized protein n=1 Tax=Brassica cretica TaxID=69181 RepID=A0A8S9P0Z7_BRACR|nr:hypothetical protein F2Q69_00009539 [Brassica cretica]
MSVGIFLSIDVYMSKNASIDERPRKYPDEVLPRAGNNRLSSFTWIMISRCGSESQYESVYDDQKKKYRHSDFSIMEKETSELRKEVDITQFLLEDIMRMVEHEYTMRVKGISGSSKELR